MKEFNTSKWRQFVIAESNFGNDPQDRYNYVRKFTADLPDTARTEQMLDNLDDALEDYKMTDEVGEFDQAFVDIMKALGKENELSENLFSPNEMSAMAVEKEMAEGKGIPDVNTDFSVGTDFSADLSENDEADEISDDDLEAAADYFDNLSENDSALDEIINEAKPNLKKALPTIAARNVERNNNINFDIEEMMDMVGEAGKGEDSKEAKILFRASNASDELEQALVDLQIHFEDNLGEAKLDKEKFTKPDQMRVNETKFEIGDKVTMKAGGGEMEIVGARKMFGNNTQAYKVKKADGETVEYSANQLKKA